MKYLAWAASDVGRRRAHNEDSYLVEPELHLYAVADGMGGHQAGEQASRLAIEGLQRELRVELSSLESASGEERLRRAAERTGVALYGVAQAEPALTGMGTTLTALFFKNGRAHVIHVGDSRCYLYRHGQCRQLTEDHLWVNEQVRLGLLSPEEARTSRLRHVITRSVGFEPTVSVDSRTLAVEPGDAFLLCSDGLSNYLEENEIARLLGEHFFAEAPLHMTELANRRGGDDNITAIVVYAGNDASPAPA